MKMLFSITYYHPYVSGLTIYVKRLAEAFAKRKNTVSVLTMQHEQTLKTESREHGVYIRRAQPTMPVSKGFLSWDFLRLAWKTVAHTDVVIINLPQFEGVWVATVAKIFHKRIIAIYHCEVVLPGGFGDTLVQSILEISNFLTLTFADTVVTYTRDFAASSEVLKSLKRAKPTVKILTVYPPIPELRIHHPKRARLKESIGEEGIIIGVAARVAAEKGIEYLFAAIPALKKILGGADFKIVVAGPEYPVGEEAYRQKINRLVKKHKKHIVFLGGLEQSQMGAFYSLLDVLVLPSVNSTEAFGMVQIEAMYAGVPVVVSNLPGVRQPVRKTGMGIIVEPRDSEGIAQAIGQIIKDKKIYVKDKALIAKEFGMEKTVHFYDTLLR